MSAPQMRVLIIMSARARVSLATMTQTRRLISSAARDDENVMSVTPLAAGQKKAAAAPRC